MTASCEGLTILDFSWGMPGGIATMILADYGAEVIKVEPPTGDPFRAVPGFLLWNRGKKSLVLDLKTSEGQERIKQLTCQADVVVESFRPGVTERLGIDYETLSRDNSALVYCSITGFGPKGPYSRYKGYEGVVAAKSGRMMSFAGGVQREGPIFSAVKVASHATAQAAARGILAALYLRLKTGHGQQVETSLLQGVSPYDMATWLVRQLNRRDPEKWPHDPYASFGRQPTLQYLPARTKDGRWIQLANTHLHLFRAAVKAIGLGYVFDNPRFENVRELDEVDREALRNLMLVRMQEKTADEWMEHFIKEAPDVAAEPFMSTQEGMNHEQMRHNGHVVEVQDPRVGRMEQLGPITKIGDAYPKATYQPAPSLGQHTDEILTLLNGGKRSTAREIQNQAPWPKHPLEGITVLDFSSVIAGPLSASLLAELGARVIRFETLEGDLMRPLLQGVGMSRTNGGKETIAIDLKTPQGREICQKMLKDADIVLHNMRPGAPARLGLDYESVRKINPRIVYLYGAGYGSTGPHSHRPVMHPIAGAVAGGALYQMGHALPPPSEEPLEMDEIMEVSRRLGRANEVNPDPNSSMVFSTAMMLGLYLRELTGQSQKLESVMICANGYANADDFFSYEGKPPRALPDVEGYGLGALYRLYQAESGWVFLACLFEKEWQTLCRVLGRGDLLTDPRFIGEAARQAHDKELATILEAIFATHPAAEWEEILTSHDIACVQADHDMFEFWDADSHIKENNFITDVVHARFGQHWRHNTVINFSETPGKVGPGILKGEHTQKLLRELGYSEQEILDLKEANVVTWEDP
ncbi:MAG: CoA transferase [Candidatus Tectomicrobia bacterium]|nr:CoA transferase [Candidatus Tectomicrobia bacterium]